MTKQFSLKSYNVTLGFDIITNYSLFERGYVERYSETDYNESEVEIEAWSLRGVAAKVRRGYKERTKSNVTDIYLVSVTSALGNLHRIGRGQLGAAKAKRSKDNYSLRR